jgi:transcriptional regulator with XRE-family HTH domain
MQIGDRLRELREQKEYTQGEVAKRTGLLKPYVSRVENGHSVPGLETLEKFARALEVPMYQLFLNLKGAPKLPNLPKRWTANGKLWGSAGSQDRLLAKFCRLFNRMQDSDRGLLLLMAQKMARRKAV